MNVFSAASPPVAWIGGYECADHLNKFGDRANLLYRTGHLSRLQQDYQDLQQVGITAAREGICWSAVETAPYQYDWSLATLRILTAQAMQVQLWWDICHFGFPADLSPLHPHFADRFEALCLAFVRHYRQLLPEGTICITPINEISFLSWLGGDACGTVPYCVRQGWEVKYHLCKAFIRAVKAVRAIDGDVCVVSTEPLIRVVCGEHNTGEEKEQAARLCEEQHQALHILTGRCCPELGGSDDCIDLVGVNFYFHNQWSHAPHQPLPWASHDRHPQWTPLHQLLREVHQRYGKPLLLAETSHAGTDRGLWMDHIAEECALALQQGLPLKGICLYPIIDRPDWDFPEVWHRSGLWDEAEVPQPDRPQRIPCPPYLDALQRAQLRLRRAALKSLPISLPSKSLMTLATAASRQPALPDVILCFSHLRWDFVYQRPQHLLSRLSETSRVYYIEEPVFGGGAPRFEASEKSAKLAVLVPHLPGGLTAEENTALLKGLVDKLVAALRNRSTGLWYYTPMALPFTRHLENSLMVFDCMDELSAFRFAPAELLALEGELLDRADVVFTGGASLYEAKKHRNPAVHLFPSSIDRSHFGQTRDLAVTAPRRSAARLGFFGVIDERFDTALLAEMAAMRPDWEFEIVGPVVKIDPASLPQASNIFYPGSKQYAELPAILSGWDIALIPFALNESTRFISPTKTPEYLAAGKPVISAPICDVITPYGDLGLVSIADTPAAWIAAAERILDGELCNSDWLAAVDAFLAGNSWDATVAAMQEQMRAACAARRSGATAETFTSSSQLIHG